jgi:hypothetical protein
MTNAERDRFDREILEALMNIDKTIVDLKERVIAATGGILARASS